MRRSTALRLQRLRVYRVSGKVAPPSAIAGLRKTLARNAIELARTTDPAQRALIEEDNAATSEYLDALLRRKLVIERAKAHGPPRGRQ
jgi:hypothetical protein